MNSATTDIEAYLDTLTTTEEIKTLYRRFGWWFGWAALGTISLANIGTLMAGTIINVAIPHIMGAFGIGQDKAQWLATAFLAASTVTMLMNAWVIRNLGVRHTVVLAMMMFMAGSVLGGVSPTVDLLIIARILQGAATGIITPLGMSIAFLLFPAEKIGRVMGISAIAVVTAPALGPMFGGLLIDGLNWRYVYLLGVPTSLIVVPLSLVFLPPREANTQRIPLDWPGLALIILAISAFLIVLSNGQREGWTSNYILLWSATALASGAAFLLWQNRTEHPLLDLEVFRYPRFSVLSILAFIFGFVLYGSTYLVPLFLQLVQHLNASDAGLLMLPAGLVMAVMFPLGGRMADNLDHRFLLVSGGVIITYSSWLMSGADRLTDWWSFAIWVMISRVGISLMSPALNLGSLQSVPAQYLQQAAGVTNFIRQLGGAFGVNVLAMTLSLRTSFHADALAATQSYGHSDTLDMIAEIHRNLASAGAGLTYWEQQYVTFGALGQLVFERATAFGFTDDFLFLTVICLIATLMPYALMGAQSSQSPKRVI